MLRSPVLLASLFVLAPLLASDASFPDGASVVVKQVLQGNRSAGPNLLRPDQWQQYQQGFTAADGVFVCDNGPSVGQRGASQRVDLNQRTPQPIVASAWSRAEKVGGTPDSDYAVYVDLLYDDGTPLWGRTASFATGTHDFQRREVVILPDKPVKSLTFYLLFRGQHTGRAHFRDPELRVLGTLAGSCVFDGVPVTVATGEKPAGGFQLRDVAAGSDYVRAGQEALGVRLDAREAGGLIDVTLTDTTGRDRALTLVYAVPVEGDGWSWLANPRRSEATTAGREYSVTHAQDAGMGRLSRYPFAAIARGDEGLALGIDMDAPAFFRAGFNAGTRELFLAFDIGLAPEKPAAHLRFSRFSFLPTWGFRSALEHYYRVFPGAFTCRTREQGLWMPFARISTLTNWSDFGFRFKEGHDETAWDDAHGILTFRYTEPMTWWMPMGKDTERTPEAALAEAQRRAREGEPAARAFLTSAIHGEDSRPALQLRRDPWCDGAVWSMNSMPGIPGAATDFQLKWNARLREELYGPGRKADLDGEYVDSVEGYVTHWLDFRRDHFPAAATPLVFDPATHRPSIFRGLIAFEYVRALARDLHGMNKLVMANGTPDSLCWLVPSLDVLGTETDWNPGGSWQPMADEELLYRRALCREKPYCFLMNTDFTKLTHDRVERYMRRCLAYGMFPGFFSADASTGQYFARPELYERDRPLFRRYVPLCRRVAEAGWQPITLARSSDARVHLERFGQQLLTVFNESPEARTVTITVEGMAGRPARDLVTNAEVDWDDGVATLTLAPEAVAVLEFR